VVAVLKACLCTNVLRPDCITPTPYVNSTPFIGPLLSLFQYLLFSPQQLKFYAPYYSPPSRSNSTPHAVLLVTAHIPHQRLHLSLPNCPARNWGARISERERARPRRHAHTHIRTDTHAHTHAYTHTHTHTHTHTERYYGERGREGRGRCVGGGRGRERRGGEKEDIRTCTFSIRELNPCPPGTSSVGVPPSRLPACPARPLL
jgi:hypothetical protein